MHRDAEQALRSRLDQHTISPAQHRILRHLWDEPDLSQATLCKRLGVEQPTLSATLKRMVRDGLLKTRQNPKDRRKISYELTQKSLDLEQPLTLAENELEETALTGFNPIEKGVLAKFFNRVTDNLVVDLDDSALVLTDVVFEPDDDLQPLPEDL